MNGPDDATMKKNADLFTGFALCAIVAVALKGAGAVATIAAPRPGAARAVLELFSKKPVQALVGFGALSIPAGGFMAIVYLGLKTILEDKRKGLAVMALFLGFLGLALELASNKAFELLYLGDAFKTANFTVKLELEAAATGLLAAMQGSSFLASRLFGTSSIFLFSWAMRSSEEKFGHLLPNLGLFAAVLTVVPPTAGKAGLVISWIALAAEAWFLIACIPVLRRAAKMLE